MHILLKVKIFLYNTWQFVYDLLRIVKTKKEVEQNDYDYD